MYLSALRRLTLILLSTVGLLGASSRQEAAAPLDSAPVKTLNSGASVASYTGSQSCALCHEGEYAAWKGSHHDLAMQEANQRTVLGDFNQARFTHLGVTSSFFQREAKFFVNTEGPDGRPRDYEIKYTFGITPLQQYLVEFPGGRFQMLGIAWDTRPKHQGGQRWFHLYPNEALKPGDAVHWTGIDQVWNYQCAECHSTNLHKNYDADKRTYATTFSEINVGCESCHGPGSMHEAWAREGAKDRTGSMGLTVRFSDRKTAGWKMNETTGTVQRAGPAARHDEVETCAFCHARRGVLHEGHRPGRPIADTHRVAWLDEALYHADGQIREEVYEYGSFRQSKMYQAGVTCSDCHDPHRLQQRTEGNALCWQCHAPDKFDNPAHHHHQQGSTGAACVSCHMLQRSYMVVDPRRDHSFRVPRPDLSVQLGTPNTCNDCHTDRDARWAEKAFFDWYGKRERPHYAETFHAARNQLPGAGDMLARLARDPNTPAIVRATAVAHLAGYLAPEYVPILKQAVRDADPQVRETVTTAVMTLKPEGRLAVIEPLLADPIRSVRIEAGRALAGIPPQLLDPTQRSERDRAVDEYRAAQGSNADRPESWLNLGNLDMEMGNIEQAEREYRTALELEARWEPAYANLADLLRATGRDSESEKLLRDGIERLPNAAGLHHALGLLEVRHKNMPAALVALKRAATLDPRTARYTYVYAIALIEVGRTSEALSITEAGLAHVPYDRGLQQLNSYLKTMSVTPTK